MRVAVRTASADRVVFQAPRPELIGELVQRFELRSFPRPDLHQLLDPNSKYSWLLFVLTPFPATPVPALYSWSAVWRTSPKKTAAATNY